MNNSMFYDIFIQPFKDGFFMSLFGILIWLFTLLLSCFILAGSLYLIDDIGLKGKKGVGVVVEKWFEPEHTYNTIILVGKISVPQVNFIKDTWKATIKINDIEDDVSLPESDWNTLYINQEVDCNYKNGLFFNSLYIINVSW